MEREGALSLDNPTKLEQLISWWKGFSHKDIVIYCVLALILFAGALWGISKLSTGWQDRGIRKEKQKIDNTIQEIANIKAQQANLAEKEAEKRGELKTDMELLANATFGREEAKKEANQALANYNKAVNANTNVNASLKDLENVLEKLK